MKLQFNKPEDLSEENLKKMDAILQNKTSVILNHSNFCGHCIAMKSEFETFKNSTTHHVVEIEGGALGSFKKHKKIYSKITPKGGLTYYPTIIIFLKTDCDKAKKYLYDGPRTADGLHSFIKEKSFKKKTK